MRTLGIIGPKAGDSFLVSVSQGALTAGPYSVGSWGGGGAGGTIAINVHRASVYVAPSSVRFSVDLSASNFDTLAGDNPNYDARLHDLIYLWDFDDPGTWTAPVQNLAAHKNRNAGKGPIEANMYRTPGTYNPSVLVIEPSTGKTATASVEVVVTDPDIEFAGTKTICINPVGDDDFTGAPVGALTYEVAQFQDGEGTVWRNHVEAGVVKRFLFKGGATHVVTLGLGASAEGGTYFGSYGAGRAILRTDRKTTIGNVHFDNHVFYSRASFKVGLPYWFVNLEAAGNFDPSTTMIVSASGYDQSFIRMLDSAQVTVSDCYAHNMMNTAIAVNPPFKVDNVQVWGVGVQTAHIDNTIIQNCGGAQYQVYQAFAGDFENTWFVVSGTRIEMHPDTLDADIIRGTLRMNDARNQIVKGCDIFCTEYTQSGIKFFNTMLGQGGIGNCYGNAVEAALCIIQYNGNFTLGTTGGAQAHNLVIDGNILVVGHSSQAHLISYGTGVTFRNNLCYVPDQQRAHWTYGGLVRVNDTDAYPGDDPTVFDVPIKVYNNTLRNDRTWQNNGSEDPVEVVTSQYSQVDPPIFVHNNVMHSPYAAVPQTAFAPVSDTVLFAPRSTGWVNARGEGGEPVPTAHPEYAPLTSVKDTKPLPGSAALGAALTGNVSYMDILGTTRTAPADKGAWVA